MKLEGLLNILWDIFKVLFVPLGEYYLFYPCPVGGQYLFFDTAHWQHLSPQCDLTCYGNQWGCRTLHEERYEGQGGGNPCRWPILGHGTRWDVDVDVCGLEDLGVYPKVPCLGANEAKGCLGRFFHDVAELACEYELTTPLHLGGLYE